MVDLTLGITLKIVFPNDYQTFFSRRAAAEIDYLYAIIAGYTYCTVARWQNTSVYEVVLPSLERILNKQYLNLSLLSLVYLWCYDGHTGQIVPHRYDQYRAVCPLHAQEIAIRQLLDAELLEVSLDNPGNGAAKYRPTYIGLGLINDDTGWALDMFRICLNKNGV